MVGLVPTTYINKTSIQEAFSRRFTRTSSCALETMLQPFDIQVQQ